MNNLFRKKSLTELMKDHDPASGEHTLKRTLTATSLIFLGIGAIIGAGLFVRTAAAAANNAGPIMAPMPRKIKLVAVSVRLSVCSPEAPSWSFINSVKDFLRKRLFIEMS